MQITRSQTNIVEKILRDKDGQLVRATFCIYEQGGRIKARLLHAVLIEENSLQNNTLFIGGNIQKQTVWSDVSYNSIPSPFVSSSLLYFSGSKPRAPTI